MQRSIRFYECDLAEIAFPTPEVARKVVYRGRHHIESLYIGRRRRDLVNIIYKKKKKYQNQN